jgi:hypothetical protein
MQNLAPLARALGADTRYARQLADFFWTRMYPLDDPRYRSPACRPGGRLDLRRHRDIWP